MTLLTVLTRFSLNNKGLEAIPTGKYRIKFSFNTGRLLKRTNNPSFLVRTFQFMHKIIVYENTEIFITSSCTIC